MLSIDIRNALLIIHISYRHICEELLSELLKESVKVL